MMATYRVEAGGSRLWTRILALSAAGSALIGVALAIGGAEAASVVSVFLIALTCAGLTLIIPLRYEVTEQRLTIVFRLWRWGIPLETIEQVREARGFEPYGFVGVRFATLPGQAVTVIRREANLIRRPNLVISPRDRAEFLAHLQEARGEAST